MRRRVYALQLLVLAAMGCCHAHADSIATSVLAHASDGPNTNFSCMHTGTNTASCASTSVTGKAAGGADVNPDGSIALSASATVAYEANVTTTGDISDVLTVNDPKAAFLVFSNSVTGAIDASCAGRNGAGQCTYGAATYVQINVNNNFADLVNTYTMGDPLVPTGDSPIATVHMPVGGSNAVSIALTPGAPLDLGIATILSVSVTADSGATGSITGELDYPPIIQVLDANGNVIPDAIIGSADGYDYSPTPTSPVPEPGFLPIEIGVLSFFGWRRLRHL